MWLKEEFEDNPGTTVSLNTICEVIQHKYDSMGVRFEWGNSDLTHAVKQAFPQSINGDLYPYIDVIVSHVAVLICALNLKLQSVVKYCLFIYF